MPATATRPSHRAAARIAVVAAAPGSAPVAALRRAELADVRFVDDARDDVREDDMLLLVAAAGDVPDADAVARVSEAARARGILIAAIVAGDDAGAGSALLGAVRDAADLVMIVRTVDDVPAIVAALR